MNVLLASDGLRFADRRLDWGVTRHYSAASANADGDAAEMRRPTDARVSAAASARSASGRRPSEVTVRRRWVQALDRSTRWLWFISGVLVTAAGIVALIHPVATFAGLADILGAVFLLIAVLWMVQAFTQRAFNEFWWIGLISGILMVGIASWVGGQYFLTRAAMLLVFAGIWAAMKGVTDIMRAFRDLPPGLLADLRGFNPKGMTRRSPSSPSSCHFIALPEGGFPSRPDAAAQAIASRASQPVSRLPAAVRPGPQ